MQTGARIKFEIKSMQKCMRVKLEIKSTQKCACMQFLHKKMKQLIFKQFLHKKDAVDARSTQKERNAKVIMKTWNNDAKVMRGFTIIKRSLPGKLNPSNEGISRATAGKRVECSPKVNSNVGL